MQFDGLPAVTLPFDPQILSAHLWTRIHICDQNLVTFPSLVFSLMLFTTFGTHAQTHSRTYTPVGYTELGLHRIWFYQIRPGPDLGLQIRPGPGPEPNVLELELIHSTFICYCLHIQTETRMWVWPTCPWWNREVQITKFVKQWIPAQLHSEADASKDGQIWSAISGRRRIWLDIKIWPDFGRGWGRIWYLVQPYSLQNIPPAPFYRWRRYKNAYCSRHVNSNNG